MENEKMCRICGGTGQITTVNVDGIGQTIACHKCGGRGVSKKTEDVSHKCRIDNGEPFETGALTPIEAKKRACPIRLYSLDKHNGGGFYADYAYCIGGECMGWRWCDDKDLANRGYCGLAGKPTIAAYEV